MRAKEFMSEMIVRHNNPNGDYVIAFKDSIWIVDEDDMENPEVARKIADRIGEMEIGDLYDLVERRPDAIIARLDMDNNLMQMMGNETAQHPTTSKLIKKIVKQLDLDQVVTDSGQSIWKYEIKGKLPTEGFHGTTMKAMSSIMRKGLMAQSQGNWNEIHTEGVVFFTPNPAYAMYHAELNADKTGDIPVVVEFKIPDGNKIVPDYDIASLLYHSQSDEVINTVYQNTNFPSSDYYGVRDKVKVHQKRPENLYKDFGIFGYEGRIPASFFELIYSSLYPTQDDMSYEFDIDDYNRMSTKDFAEILKVYEEFGDDPHSISPQMVGMSYDYIMDQLRDEDEDDEDY